MSKAADPLGDVPIRLTEPMFTLPDAAFLSGVPEKSIRNWMARDVLRIGQKHFAGRWTYSVLDVLRLSIMHSLAVNISLPVRQAAHVAEVAATIATDSTTRDTSGAFLDAADGYRPNKNIVISWDEAGEPFAAVADIKRAGNYYPPASGDLRRAHVVVPVTALFNDLVLRTADLARRNARAEAPTHA